MSLFAGKMTLVEHQRPAVIGELVGNTGRNRRESDSLFTTLWTGGTDTGSSVVGENMSDWDFLNKHRVGQSGSSDQFVLRVYHTTSAEGFNGMFRFWIDGQPIRCVASDGEGWKHVSTSIEGERKPPTWGLMCKIKDLFWNDDDWVVQFHPAKSDYVNNHPGCLHLWQPTDKEFPKPHYLLVGLKSLNVR